MICWYFRRLNTVEAATFGSDLICTSISKERAASLTYKLIMFVINTVGPSSFYVDKEYVVNSLTMADS